MFPYRGTNEIPYRIWFICPLQIIIIFNILIIISCGAFVDLCAILKIFVVILLVLINTLVIFVTMQPIFKNRYKTTNAFTVKPRCSVFHGTVQNYTLYQGFLYCHYINDYEYTSWIQNNNGKRKTRTPTLRLFF